MNTQRPEPLSNEERELAEMLSRLGPHGEPSAALDARILAASHEATAGTRRAVLRKPRWPVAFGVAASMVIAVGIAWQLRPLPPPVARSEVSSSEVPAALQRPAPAQGAIPAPAGEPSRVIEQSAAAPAASANALESALPAGTGPGSEPAAVAREITAPRQRIADPTALRTQDAQAKERARPQSRVPLAPPPTAPPAAAAATAPGAMAGPYLESGQPEAFMADRDGVLEAESSMTDERATANESAAALDASKTQRREMPALSVPRRQPEERSALDRVEVTGTRLRRTDLQVPVAQDAHLQVDDWLERVRTRYGLGDEAAARQSLLLFLKDHPDEPVPGDLEPLLDQ